MNVGWTSLVQTPVDRYFNSEFIKVQKSLKHIKTDLRDLLSVLKGSLSMTNDYREYLNCLGSLGKTPVSWIDEKSRADMAHNIPSFDVYLLSLIKSFQHLSQFSTAASTSSESYVVDLSCIRDPEAFLIATRQLSATKLNVSLEQLELECKIMGKQHVNPKSSTLPVIEVTGLVLHGARWIPEKQRLELHGSLTLTPLAPVSIRWVNPAGRSKVLTQMANSGSVHLPVYTTNDSRNHVLMQVSISEANMHLCSRDDLTLRSVCVTLTKT